MHYQLEYDPKAWDGEPEKIRRWTRSRVEKDLKAFKAFIEKAE